MQKKLIVLIEQHGYEHADELMSVNKEDLLYAMSRYNDEDFTTIGTDDQPKMTEQELTELIRKYVFSKTTWYADMKNLYYVDISGEYRIPDLTQSDGHSNCRV